MEKENSSIWLQAFNRKQTKESDMLNFTPKKAIYCPLLTAEERTGRPWTFQTAGPYCSGTIIAGMILYQAVAVQRDKQRRVKHRTTRIKVLLGKQEKCRDETGEEKKRRLSLPFSISLVLPFSLSRRGENFLQKPGWYRLHPSRPAELGTKPRTYEKSNHLSLFSFIFSFF